MAAPMIAAAAVGFLGSQATSFVLAPAVQNAPSAVSAASGVQQQSSAASSGALCGGLAVGFAGAAAAASAKPRRAVARKAAFDPTSAMGVTQPTGYWDPCGLMKERKGADGFEWKDQSVFDKYRVAELKHGRVAMLAVVGMVANTVWKFEGAFQEVPDGMAALNTSVGGSGFGVLFIMAAGFEYTYPKGDFDVPGPWGATEEMKGKELANGRLAMAAVITLLVTEMGTGMAPSQQFADTFNFTLGNLAGSGGFYTAWALLVLAFAWTQPDGSSEVSWSYKNWLYSKGLGDKPEALKPVAVAAKLPAAEPVKIAAELPAAEPAKEEAPAPVEEAKTDA